MTSGSEITGLLVSWFDGAQDALDAALNKLELTYPRKCCVVELRFFGGLSVEETAEVLNISAPQVESGACPVPRSRTHD